MDKGRGANHRQSKACISQWRMGRSCSEVTPALRKRIMATHLSGSDATSAPAKPDMGFLSCLSGKSPARFPGVSITRSASEQSQWYADDRQGEQAEGGKRQDAGTGYKQQVAKQTLIKNWKCNLREMTFFHLHPYSSLPPPSATCLMTACSRFWVRTLRSRRCIQTAPRSVSVLEAIERSGCGDTPASSTCRML